MSCAVNSSVAKSAGTVFGGDERSFPAMSSNTSRASMGHASSAASENAKAAAGAAGSDAAQALDAAWKKTEEKLSALKTASGEGYAKARDEMVEAYEALRAKLGR